MQCQKGVPAVLLLEDGTEFPGVSFGYPISCSGEVVFTTGMTGYPQSLTDPSFTGQILAFTFPLIGNYGIPGDTVDENGIPLFFESTGPTVSGIVVSEACEGPSHHSSVRSLHSWLEEKRIPGIAGVDTRKLAERLRDRGTMRGKIVVDGNPSLFAEVADPVPLVSPKAVRTMGTGKPVIAFLDCGAKAGIYRNFLSRGVTVVSLPWDADLDGIEYDGMFISNGPGDPKRCGKTIATVKKALSGSKPVFGICLGNQLMALAAGGDTYKMKFGHRSQNQPCEETGSGRCLITSQNHGYAVDAKTLPQGWEPWFLNANDGTVEGIRHRDKPFRAVQFHPEACPGPRDAEYLFDEFLDTVRGTKGRA